MSKLTGLVSPGGEKAYFFTGKDYVRYDIAADAVEDGYPRPIQGAWAGLFDDIDAALAWPDGSVYFFKGAEYVKYDMAADRVVDGYPKAIAENWAGVFTEDIDAAVLWPGGESAYFFKGAEYIKFDVASDAAAEGYPKPIADNWPGVFAADIDAALAWPSGDVYILKGEEYLKYDVAADRAADGYPQPIAGNWKGLPIGASAPVTPPTPSAGGSTAVRDAFPAFTTQFEGRVSWMYLDIKGYVTVGVGNLIDSEAAAQRLPFVHKSDGSPASADEIAAEWRTLKADQSLAQKGHRAAEKVTNLRLTEAAMDDLVRAQFDANEATLRKSFPDFDSWPADARLGVHSMAWALGAGFAKSWPKFAAAARAQDWAAAAAECRIDDTGNPGVKPRNDADVELFQNAATVKAKGLDINNLFFPSKP